MPGFAPVQVRYGKLDVNLIIHVARGNGDPVVGRDWFPQLGIGIVGINATTVSKTIAQILEEKKAVFDDVITGHDGPLIHINIQENAQPKFLKARPVPFAMKPKMEKELDKLEQQGIITPVENSEWATPVVGVEKKDGGLRICGDYRSTVNRAVMKNNTYPLPTFSEMRNALANGVIYSRIDLSQAYQQLKVDEETSKLLTINTCKGLYKVNRLQFGVSVAPMLFQRYMDNLLKNTSKTKPFLDDIYVTGASGDEHNKNLDEALTRLEKAGLKVNKKKCQFGVKSVDFLGYILDATGLHPNEDKVKAIKHAPRPKNKTELQAFLGLLNFYNSFLKNRASVAKDLYELLRDGVKFEWTKRHERAFNKLKKLIHSESVLAHFDENKPLRLSCDASPYGIGVVLAHVLEDGSEAPIAFASRTMADAETRYSQLDKEALSIIYGIKYFHQYLYGREFQIVTDHKPLVSLFDPGRAIPEIIAPRLLRWALILSTYNYEIAYRPGKQHANADALSRLPLSVKVPDPPTPADVLLLEGVDRLPITAKQIASETVKDKALSRVTEYVLNGWPERCKNEEIIPFFRCRTEISIQDGCLLYGSRVILPRKLREAFLEFLHGNHPGVVAMKVMARSYVWWPKLAEDIEATVGACEKCQLQRNLPPQGTSAHLEHSRQAMEPYTHGYGGAISRPKFFGSGRRV